MNIKYGLYLNRKNTTIRFPVNPEEYVVEYPTDNTRYNVLDLGEIVVARIPNLKSVSWERYFPADAADPFALTSGRFRPPEYYIRCCSH
jgi:hypothetical protein